MCFFEKITVLVMMVLIFILSDVHSDSAGEVTHTTQPSTNLPNDEKTTVNKFLPQRFPENKSSVVFKGENIPVVPYHDSTFSPDILKTLAFSVIQMTSVGKSIKNYRCRYEEVKRNTSDPIMKIMNSVNAKSAINCNDKLLIIPESYGDPGNATQSAKNPTSDKPSDNRLPNELPKDQSSVLVNGENVPIVPFNNNSICWPNISRTFWQSMIYMQGEKTTFGKHYKRLRCRYDELTKNVTDHIMQIIYAVNELSNLLQSNGDSAKNGMTCDFKFENSLKNSATCDSRVEDSYAKSVTVPFLLIVILLLVTYIGFLYRKFQFTYYKDTQILVEDELADP